MTNLGGFTVFLPLKHNQLHRRALLCDQAIELCTKPSLALLKLHMVIGSGFAGSQQMRKRACIIHIFSCFHRAMIQAHHVVTLLFAAEIDRLIGCDGIEPWAEFAPLLERIGLAIDLCKCVLKHILSGRTVARETAEVRRQLALVLMFECRKKRLLMGQAIVEPQLIIGQ